ncbi:MFS transporter [Dactylosporangium sp. NPDC049742]|uniref:MFS transporter n=1 Tax=Dactylosporangium sp. NPDC049742 TaxID=3154737 RepID=UPI00343952FB
MTSHPTALWSLLVARGVNELGAFTLPFLTVILVRSLHVSPSAAGAIVAVFGVATIPSRILGGYLADAIGYRATIVCGLLGTAVAQVGVAFARTPVIAVLAALLLGLSFEIYEPPSQALITLVTEDDQRARAYGLQSVVMGVAATVAGVLAATVGRIELRWLFLIDATTCVLAALIIGIGLRSVPRAAADDPSPEPASAARSPWRDPALLALLAAGTVFACLFFQVNIALPLTLAGRGLDPSDVGLLMVVSTMVTAGGQLILARRGGRPDPFRAIARGYLVLAAGYLAIGLSRSLWQFLGAAAVIGVANLVLIGQTYALVGGIAPRRAIGRYMSVYGLSWGAAATIAPLGGTLALQHWGMTTTWLSITAACVTLALAQPAIARVVRPRLPAPDHKDTSAGSPVTSTSAERPSGAGHGRP